MSAGLHREHKYLSGQDPGHRAPSTYTGQPPPDWQLSTSAAAGISVLRNDRHLSAP